MGEADVTYQGGGSIVLQVTLTAGMVIPARVYLNQLTGVVRVRLPSTLWSDMIGVTFLKDPGISFTVDTPLTVGDNEMVRSMINKLLASIVRKTFLELWVLPGWRTFFLPQMQPSPEDIIARQQQTASKATAGTTSRPYSASVSSMSSSTMRNTLANRASALWESRMKGSKTLQGDLLVNETFDLSTKLSIPLLVHSVSSPLTASASNSELQSTVASYESMHSSLIQSMMHLVQEPDEPHKDSGSTTSTLQTSHQASNITSNVATKEYHSHKSSKEHAGHVSTSPKNTQSSDTASIASASTLIRDPEDSTGNAASNPNTSWGWRTIKSRQGVTLQKRLIISIGATQTATTSSNNTLSTTAQQGTAQQPTSTSVPATATSTTSSGTTDMVRAIIHISCDAERVFRVLMNPEHFAHMNEYFESAQVLHEYDASKSIVELKFKTGKSVKTILALCSIKECKQTASGDGKSGGSGADSDDGLGGDGSIPRGARIVVMRSIGSLKVINREKEQIPPEPSGDRSTPPPPVTVSSDDEGVRLVASNSIGDASSPKVASNLSLHSIRVPSLASQTGSHYEDSDVGMTSSEMLNAESSHSSLETGSMHDALEDLTGRSPTTSDSAEVLSPKPVSNTSFSASTLPIPTNEPMQSIPSSTSGGISSMLKTASIIATKTGSQAVSVASRTTWKNKGSSEGGSRVRSVSPKKNRKLSSSTNTALTTNGSNAVSSASQQTSPPPLDTSIPTKSASMQDVPDIAAGKQYSDLYIYGYYVTPSPEDPANQCIVTLISHMSPSLSRLEIDFNTCRRLKQFIEELDQFTRGMQQQQQGNSGSSVLGVNIGGEGFFMPNYSDGLRRRANLGFGLGNNSNTDSIASNSSNVGMATGQIDTRIEKLKTYIGNTASFLMKQRKTISSNWSNSPSSSVTSSNNPYPNRVSRMNAQAVAPQNQLVSNDTTEVVEDENVDAKPS